MDDAERLKRLRRMLLQIAPESQLEGLTETLQAGDGGGGTETPALDVGRPTDDESFALETLDVLVQNGIDTPLDGEQQEALEAIIHKRYRPALFIIRDTFATPPTPWTELGTNEQMRQRIENAIPSIGRIEIPNDPRGRPYAGTGFVVGDGLIMTNRHVAELFANGLGLRDLVFKPGQTAGIDFKQEQGSTETLSLDVERVVMIHPYWDMALLRVKGLPERQRSLSLSITVPEELADQNVAVIGYPGQDERNDLYLQNKIFGGVFYVKRLQPGKLKVRRERQSFGRLVNAVTHDSSTLAGNSGSAVIDVQTGEVVGLHFAGEYLDANFAVPAYELARDSRCVDAGINFTGRVQPGDIYPSIWKLTDTSASTA